MRVGFTGTRHGMADEQHRAFIAWAKGAGATEFHHGCCLGADAEGWEVMTSAPDLGFATPKVVAHPPTNRSMVSESALMLSDERRKPRPYLDRNHGIVNDTDLLVACPQGMAEEQRSGTWATVRYARKAGKPIVIVWPDGTVTREERP